MVQVHIVCNFQLQWLLKYPHLLPDLIIHVFCMTPDWVQLIRCHLWFRLFTSPLASVASQSSTCHPDALFHHLFHPFVCSDSFEKVFLLKPVRQQLDVSLSDNSSMSLYQGRFQFNIDAYWDKKKSLFDWPGTQVQFLTKQSSYFRQRILFICDTLIFWFLHFLADSWHV